MKKRILAVLLTLCMALSLLPTGVLADDAPTSGTCGENLNWTLSGGTLSISGTGKMTDYGRKDNAYTIAPWCKGYEDHKKIQKIVIEPGVTSIGSNAFDLCANVKDVTIPEGVTSIGDDAFCSCKSLESINLPASVTEIECTSFRHCTELKDIQVAEGNPVLCVKNGLLLDDGGKRLVFGISQKGACVIPEGVTVIGEFAFDHDVELTDVTIPNSVTVIEDCAFEGCTGLTGIVIPDSVTSIGYYAFDNCINLASVKLPGGITAIEDYTFNECNSLKSIDIPNGVTSIGLYAFDGCHSMTSATIPNSVIFLDSYAFGSCESLENVILPASVTTMECGVFSGCAGLKNIQVAEENPNYSARDGILYNKEKTELLAYPSAKGVADIPNGVTVIGEDAFYRCNELTGINIPNSVTVIRQSAFDECVGLTDIIIPENVTSVEAWAFADCSSLKTVNFLGRITVIGNASFWRCGSLTAVGIPDSVTTIEDFAFVDCDSLTNVYYGGSEADWAKIKIGGANDPLKKATIHYNAEMPKPPTPPVTDPCADGHTWDSGNITKQPTDTEKGERTYICTICGEAKTEEIPATGGTVTPPAPDVPAVRFTDVAAGAYYADAVSWAVSSGITTGTTKTTFSPDEPCTRAQAVTFLWRAAGSPEPENAKNPFADVADNPDTNWCYQAILWAVEKGITTGTDAAYFSPDKTCNRAQIVTFLHRYAGSPAASGMGFGDVPAGEYYHAPVLWAVSKGVTNGTDTVNNLFSPMDNCTRGQIVTFLYRDMVG